MKHRTSYRMLLIIVRMLVVFTGSVTLQAEEEKSIVTQAWDAFNAKEYQEAIKLADQCIQDFGEEAANTQKAMEENKEPEPPVGKVDDATKQKIFERGLLNDVATAYFIKGRSAEKLYRQDKTQNAEYKKTAEEAYKTVCASYKYGRTWDPKGWFWSPCTGGSESVNKKGELR